MFYSPFEFIIRNYTHMLTLLCFCLVMQIWAIKRTSLVSLFDWNCLAVDAILIDLVYNILVLDMSFFNFSLDMLTFKTYILLETLILMWTLSIFIEMPTLGVNLVLFRKDYGIFKTFLNTWSSIIFNRTITSSHSRWIFSKKKFIGNPCFQLLWHLSQPIL
jgi:hypothetical protein